MQTMKGIFLLLEGDCCVLYRGKCSVMNWSALVRALSGHRLSESECCDCWQTEWMNLCLHLVRRENCLTQQQAKTNTITPLSSALISSSHNIYTHTERERERERESQRRLKSMLRNTAILWFSVHSNAIYSYTLAALIHTGASFCLCSTTQAALVF